MSKNMVVTISSKMTASPTSWIFSLIPIESVKPKSPRKPSIPKSAICPPSSIGIGSKLNTPKFKLINARMDINPTKPCSETTLEIICTIPIGPATPSSLT